MLTTLRKPKPRTLGGSRPRRWLPTKIKATVSKYFSKLFEPVTGLGWMTVILLIVATAAWWVGHWEEFLILALGLAILLVIAALFLIGRAKYEVILDLRTNRVVVGEHATGRLEVKNSAGRRLFPSRMELPVGSAAATFRLPSLASEESHEELFVVPTHRRAVIPVGPARSVRGDALGMLRREILWTEPQMLYVHPRTIGLNDAAPGFLRDLEGQATRDLTNSDVSFHALRGYVPGDDRRYIHWRSSARTGTLMVRQFEETRRSHLVVAISTAEADYADPEEFELAVEAGASIGVQAFREEQRISLISSEAVLPTQTARRLLDQFSGVEIQSASGSIVELARKTSKELPDASVAMLMCGSAPTPAQIRRAGASLPLGVRVIAVRAVPGAALTLRTIAGVSVITIGQLEDLPRALRKAKAA